MEVIAVHFKATFVCSFAQEPHVYSFTQGPLVRSFTQDPLGLFFFFCQPR